MNRWHRFWRSTPRRGAGLRAGACVCESVRFFEGVCVINPVIRVSVLSVPAPPGVFETGTRAPITYCTGRFHRAATFSNETSKVQNGWASTPLAAADTSKTCDGLSKSCAALVGGSGGVGSSCSARCQSTRRPPRRSRASQATRTAAPRPASRRAIFGTCACGIVMRWWVQTMRSPPLWLVVGAWRRLLRRWCMASTSPAAARVWAHPARQLAAAALAAAILAAAALAASATRPYGFWR